MNIPKVKLGLVAVSRDCFPIELSRKRRVALVKECQARKLPVVEIPTIIENEKHVHQALEELRGQGVNALVIFLGNFGPEGPTTMLAQRFDGPVMLAAAAEETQEDLYQGRGDALCGMLNVSYNLGLRRLRPYIPEYPVGTAADVRGHDRRLPPGRAGHAGAQESQDLRLRPPAAGFPRLQRPDQAALRPRRRDHGELRTRPLRRSSSRPRADPGIKAVARDMAKEVGEAYALSRPAWISSRSSRWP